MAFFVTPDSALDFLEDKLNQIGLNDKEANDFISFWLPVLQRNQNSLVSFQFDNYSSSHLLKIDPQPDSILRVFLAIRPIKNRLSIAPQELPRFNRIGFSVVEWGGTN